MQYKRYVAAAATAGLLAIGPLSGFATAATASGVGTATVSSTVLGVQLGANGDLLSIRVLGDDGTATIDPANGTPVATESLTALAISSKLVPAINLTEPAVTTTSTGAEDKKTVAPDLPDVPAFSGDLSAVLSSLVDATGAKSGLQAGLSNLSVAGGLLSLPSAVANVSSSAVNTDATGSRTIEIPSIEVLDLAALLNALGTSLTALPLDTVVGLLGSLGVPVPNVTDPATAVETLQGLINTLQNTTVTTVGDLCNQVDDTIDGLLTDPAGTIGGTVGGLSIAALPIDCSDTTQTISDLIDQVQDQLASLLALILNLLAETPLLSVTDVKVSLIAKAADTVGNSVADVTASIGEVKVGNLAVPAVSGLNLGAAADTINAATEAVQAAVGGVLSQISSQLANLVDVDVLKITEGVTSADGYNNAAATITALTATITPPTDVLTLAALGDTPVSTVLGDLGAGVPAVATLMTQLEAALGGLQALTGPSTITVASLSAGGSFKALGASSTPTGELPRTGGNAAVPAMLAMALAGAAIAIRRVLRVVTA